MVLPVPFIGHHPFTLACTTFQRLPLTHLLSLMLVTLAVGKSLIKCQLFWTLGGEGGVIVSLSHAYNMGVAHSQCRDYMGRKTLPDQLP